MYLRKLGTIIRFGGFMIAVPNRNLLGMLFDHYVNKPLPEIPGVPPVPAPYSAFILKQFTIIDVIDELILVFEEPQ